MTKRIGSALALIFVFSLGQFVLAMNNHARTIASPTAFAQEDQNRREDRRDGNQYRRRHRKHRRHWMQQQDRRSDRRDNRNSNRRP